MMTELLNIMQWALNYSILLSAQLLVLLLLRPVICSWLGAVSSYRLWLLPLIWLPFYLINWSSINWNGLWSSIAGSNLSGTVSGGLVVQTLIDLQLELPFPSLPEFTLTGSSAPDLWIWLSGLWIAGVFILLGKETYRIVRFNSYVDFTAQEVMDTEARLIRGNTNLDADVPMVYLKGIESPALYGLFHPVLLLPEDFLSNYNADQRHIILSHEAVHLRRKDNFWNLATCLLKILFWFNPLLYLAHHCYRLDQELSCDALALTWCDKDQTRLYARTLLAAVAKAGVIRHPPIIAAWENPKLLKQRIQMIEHHLANRNHSILMVISLLIISMAGAGLTSCVSDNVSAQVAVSEDEQGRRAPPDFRNEQVMSRAAYERMDEVMGLMDSEDYAGAMEILKQMISLDEAGKLNTREQFVMWQFVANIYQAQERYHDALITYKNILGLENLDQQQRAQTLVYIGSLNFVVGDYLEAVQSLEESSRISDEPDADVYYRIGVAYYQLEKYSQAVPAVVRSMEILNDKGEEIPKHTYDLLRTLYLMVEDTDAAVATLESAIDIFNDEQDRELLSAIQASLSGEPLTTMASLSISQDIASELQEPRITARDIEILPLVTVAPVYPRRAAARGVEGWILVGFTVSETGEVVAPEVIDAEPEYIFDRSALEAIEKFKFNPKIIDDEAVEVPGVRYMFRFNLSG